jgi:aspartate-semialdehyde dehydrogenase
LAGFARQPHGSKEVIDICIFHGAIMEVLSSSKNERRNPEVVLIFQPVNLGIKCEDGKARYA